MGVGLFLVVTGWRGGTRNLFRLTFDFTGGDAAADEVKQICLRQVLEVERGKVADVVHVDGNVTVLHKEARALVALLLSYT